MSYRRLTAAGLLALFLGAAAPPARAQQPCQAPPALPQAAGANIFSIQQEVDLGDASAEQIQREKRVIDDEEVTGYLANVANRMAAQLPGEHPRMRVFLVDDPDLNAFSLPGGRIYVTRKMAAFFRNDDEMAALLGHEMGHILSRQFGVEWTERFRGVLGVTHVTDRQDIYAKYNQFLDNYARKIKLLEKEELKEEPRQYQADQIALIAMANAGFSPQAFVEFFDRFAETHGRKGSWFSDLFGAPPEQKRLRVMHRALGELPAGCAMRKESAASKEFMDWQSAVAGYAGLNRREVLRGVAAMHALSPPLRTDVKHLKYCPNGRCILAQDDSSIYILSREPFQAMFRIPAEDAEPAQFSPDSESVVFHTRGLHVEKWSIANETRTFSKELFVRQGCRQTALSPDGKTLVCYQQDFTLNLYDVDTGLPYFTHKYTAYFQNYFEALNELLSELLDIPGPMSLHIRFSPDGRYLVAAKRLETVAVDLTTRSQVHTHGPLSQDLAGSFDFLSPDRIIRMNVENLRKSDVLGFPSGETIATVALGGDRLDAATHGNTVFVGPLKDAPAGLMDVATQKLSISFKKSTAVDAYDQAFVSERYSGAIGEYGLPGGQSRGVAVLPPGLLGNLRGGAASPDLRWLALSGSSRGAVWDLATGERRYYFRGFHGGYFDASRAFYAEFPKLDQQARSIARADLMGTDVSVVSPLGDDDATSYAGRFVFTRKPAGKNKDDKNPSRKITLEARDVSAGTLLWSTDFPQEAPRLYPYSAPVSLVLEWGLGSEAAKSLTRKDEALRTRVGKIDKPEESYLLEVVDPATGNPKGYVPLDTGKGSFKIKNAYASGDFLVVSDSNNRVRLYSISMGRLLGTYFGSNSALSERNEFLCVENEPGKLNLYDLKTLESKASYTFGYPIAFGQFSEDGKRLLIVTVNQKAYLLDVARDAARP